MESKIMYLPWTFAEWWPGFPAVSDGFFQIAVYEWLGVHLCLLDIWTFSQYKQTNLVCLKMTIGTKRTVMGNIRPYKESKVLIISLTPAIAAPCCYVVKAPLSVGATYALERCFPTSYCTHRQWKTSQKKLSSLRIAASTKEILWA